MQSRAKALAAYLAAVLLLTGCSEKKQTAGDEPAVSSLQMMELNEKNKPEEIDDAYRNVYEIFPYSYCDSNGDGIGDLQGIISKLDYIHDTGFNAIWLTPVCPSPSYHKYDITDYESIDQSFGTLADYDQLVKEAHERNMKVYFDLVINHTSSSHPWFQKAAVYLKQLGDNPVNPQDCPYVSYYNFTKKKDTGYASLPGTDWYYEARFSDGMPDLNLDNENVRNEIRNIMQFWIDHKVDGFRLDAVTSYYTGQPEKNIQFLTWLNQTGKQMKPDLYFVGEAWTQQSEYASYYASGIDSFFDFAAGDNDGLIAKTLKGDFGADDFVSYMAKEEELYGSYSPAYINAPFYTNHDMNRSAGYYAGDDGTLTKEALAMNLLMSGNAFLYYGDEIGMKGSGIDENKRAPMYWSDDQTEDTCNGPAGMGKVTMKFPPLDQQEEDPLSIYSYVKQALLIRNAFPTIARGRTIVHDEINEEEYAVFERKAEGYPSVLIAINTSGEEEQIDLSKLNYKELSAVLTSDENKVTYEDGILNLPAHAIVVMEADQ